MGISDFRLSGQSPTKENCYNSRASNGIDMKLGLVTKLDKRNTATSDKIDDDLMSSNYDVMLIFLIYGQFEAVRKPDTRCMVCKS